MHKKLAATLTITIFLLSTLAIMAPVQAHFTLGDYTDTYPYHTTDFDPHTDGVIGYVWPGGGENSYLGSPNIMTSTLPPGYQSPWAEVPVFNPPSQTWYQLAYNAYAPFGAILVDSKGDLIFAINATADMTKPDSTNKEWGWASLDILIPPEFGNILPEQVVSTITNDYSGYTVTTLSPFDRYAPGWTLVQIIADGNNNAAVNTWLFNGTETDQWYYVRINGVTAPTVAGKYFFKMFLGGVGASGECDTGCQPDYWLPTENWPVLLVKGEVDPAIIWGTIKYGGWNASLYNQPIDLPGMVLAKMTTKLDPYTGESTTLPLTDAVGYFNNTAHGHYEVEGVAAGIYDIYASAAGYPQQLIASGVHVLKGQSLRLDGYLNPGVVIHGNVYTKHMFGEEPWPRDDYIKIEIYDAPTVNHIPDSKANLVSWSPLPCVAAGPGATYTADDASGCDPTANVAFPWYDLTSITLVTNGDVQGVGPAQTWQVAGGTTTPFHFEFGQKGMYGAPRDLDGHVPQMNATWVNGLTPGRYYARAWITQYVQSELDGATFHEIYFDVSAMEWAGDIALPIDLRLSSYVNKTVYFHDTPGTLMHDAISTGATQLQGMLVDGEDVQWAWNNTAITATGIDSGVWNITFYGYDQRWDGRDYGIPAGTYTPKVYAMGYVQQTFEQVSITLSGTETHISDHLNRGVGFNITIYSTDFERPRVDRNWLFPDSYIYLTITFGETSATRSKFVKQKADQSYVSGSSSSYTTDGVYWGKGGDTTEGGVTSYYDVFMEDASPSFGTASSFDSGQYSFKAQTYGYVQKKDFAIYALKGQIADIKINLVIGVNLTVDILFKKENIITPTNMNMSARIRFFDEAGEIVGEWQSSQGVLLPSGAIVNYIPGGASSMMVTIAGFEYNFGDPIWGVSKGFGIDGYPNYQGGYTVEVDFVPWYRNNTAAGPVYYSPVPGLLMGESFHTVPGHPENMFGWTEEGALKSKGALTIDHTMAPNHLGPYAQRGVWSLPNAHLSGEASGVWEVDLRGYLSGTVLGFTWCGEFRTQSWATVSIVGADGFSYNSFTFDGMYEFYAAPGMYTMTIAGPGLTTASQSLFISDGQSTTGTNFYLEQSQIPIPEFTGLAVVAFSALAASLYLLRRRRH